MDRIDPEIARRLVPEVTDRHRDEIRRALHEERLARELAGADRAPVPWRLSVARLLYRAGDALAGSHAYREVNACR